MVVEALRRRRAEDPSPGSRELKALGLAQRPDRHRVLSTRTCYLRPATFRSGVLAWRGTSDPVSLVAHEQRADHGAGG